MDKYVEELEKENIKLRAELSRLKKKKSEIKREVALEIFRSFLGVMENVPGITVDTIRSMIEFELGEL